MEVTVAKSAGFCFGVKRAVQMVYDEAGRERKVYTLGPIIHNEQVVADLQEGEDATVIIRSHGVGREVTEALQQKNVRIVDATCPFVKKIHNIVREKREEGYAIVVVGSASHPEVEGICSWCGNECYVAQTPEDAV